MTGLSFHAGVQAAFEAIGVQKDGAAEKVLDKVGVDALHAMLDQCCSGTENCSVSADSISVKALKAVFAANKWPEDSSITKKDLACLLDSLGVPETDTEDTYPEDEPEAAEDDLSTIIAKLVEPLHARARAKKFPILRLQDLQDPGAQAAAQDIVRLSVGADVAKIQSYVDEQMRFFFEDKPTGSDASRKKQEALWMYEHYYEHVGVFLIKESLA